ncbi:hypothetical protein O7632_22335 [Solwaraspora sp. WMMD406]|uniref:hypothetical protein n=1 Tax=Solwaraspora sp. WMMD406 TaxID=3016095 RepID=UPI0024171D97|nr:hypothetical protein [Solwaraspora sp. WMMD406]MDG4766815.1 hypothetical protein [Solwaraspora sp. WMMD406]
MAVLWLGGAVLLTFLSGFLIGQGSGFLIIAVALVWASAAAYVVAAIWPAQAPYDGPASRSWIVVNAGRTLLGIAVAVLSSGFALAYGEGNLSPYGEQVTAEITEISDECAPEAPSCHPSYRLSVAGDDLGWVPVCAPAGPVGTTVEVDVDPNGQRRPWPTSCIPGRDSAQTITTLCVGGVGTIGLVAVADSGWRANRSRVLRRRGDTEPD